MSVNCLHRALSELCEAAMSSRPPADARPWPFVIQGTAAMKLHGIPVEPGDIDIFAERWLYDALRERRGWIQRWPNDGDPPLLEWNACRIPVNVWYAWDDRSWRWSPDPIAEAFENQERVSWSSRQWPVLSLQVIYRWKSLIGRPKDAMHLQMIEDYWQTVVPPYKAMEG